MSSPDDRASESFGESGGTVSRVSGLHSIGFCAAAAFALCLLATPAPALVAASRGQDGPSLPSPRFEVASLKPVDPKADSYTNIEIHPGGRLIISGFTLKDLIVASFNLSYWQISGGEPWMGKDQFRIDAVPPERVKIRTRRHGLFNMEDQYLREMMQALLIDRFHLKFRQETKPGTVYLLKRSDRLLRLRQTEAVVQVPDSTEVEPFGSIGNAGGIWVISAATTSQLANFTSAYILHAPVADQTGLSAPYDYRQRDPDPELSAATGPESFLKLISEIGLKLERSRGAVETFVTESATKPSAN